MSKTSEVLLCLVKKQGLSLLELERKTGISNAQLGKYVSGYYEPSLPNALILADYFSCSLDFLCGLEEIQSRFTYKRSCDAKIFIERYNQLLKQKRSNDNRISIELGFARNCSMRWRKNMTFPTLSILAKMAVYFAVPIEYLVGRIDL